MKPLLAAVAIYFAASLAHFTHNAEFIAFYPGMPRWITRETVYLAWLGVTGIGVAAWVLFSLRLHALGLLALAVYGFFGLDGLAHYTLALCSEHTVLANVTIWSEALAGTAVLLLASARLGRTLVPRPAP